MNCLAKAVLDSKDKSTDFNRGYWCKLTRSGKN